MRHQMQREHAQIMKITNVFFYPISVYAQTNLIIELKLTESFQQEINVLISEKFSQYDDTFSSSLCHSHYNKFINKSQFSALFVRKILEVMIWFLKL